MSKKKGLNMEKVNKVMESVEEVMNTEVKKVVVDEKINEEVAQDDKEIIGNEIFKEEIENNKMVESLNYNIKKAIFLSKGYGKRGITGKQFKSIVEGYKKSTGLDMTEERVNYLKTITDVQAGQVIMVINKFNRYMRLQQAISPVTNA